MTSALVTRGLRKTYGNVQALKGLDLDVKRGEVFGFLGPNGAGKTTFTKCVTGFVRPNAGQVQICGVDALANPTRAAHHVGLVPDQYDFYGNLTGRQHLDFYGRLLGLTPGHRKDRIAEVLATVRMEERADSRVKGYSHGMKQRICIAQAILHEPELILFDEPTNGLDPQGAYELREMIKGLAKGGTTIFLNSHQLTEVEQTCQRVAILNQGELKTVGDVSVLRRSAGNAVRVRLVKSSPALAKTVERAIGALVSVEGNGLAANITEAKVPDMVAAIVNAGGRILAVEPQVASLEDVFLEVVGEGGAA